MKPDAALEMIEHYYPNLPKIELHRRGPARPGWEAWGDEALATVPCLPAASPSDKAPEQGGAEVEIIRAD